MDESSIPGKLDDLTSRVGKIEGDVGAMRKDMAENTELTRDIRDAVIAGRVMARVLKWTGAIAAACSAVWIAFYQITHHGKSP